MGENKMDDALGEREGEKKKFFFFKQAGGREQGTQLEEHSKDFKALFKHEFVGLVEQSNKRGKWIALCGLEFRGKRGGISHGKLDYLQGVFDRLIVENGLQNLDEKLDIFVRGLGWVICFVLASMIFLIVSVK